MKTPELSPELTILIPLRALLEDHWCRGDLADYRGNYCLMGGFLKVACDWDEYTSLPDISNLLDEQRPKLLRILGLNNIAEFNDGVGVVLPKPLSNRAFNKWCHQRVLDHLDARIKYYKQLEATEPLIAA